jgi:putative ABC transport system permease protein
MVLRTGADSEMTSGLSREQTRLIADAPGVARADGVALASAELFVIINLPKRSTGTDANVPMRGVDAAAYAVRGNVEIIEGRRFESGRNEVVVGIGAARSFAGLEVGNTIRLGASQWNVVGVFTAGGGVAESEVWTDASVLQSAYHRGDSFQAVYARLTSPAAFGAFRDALTKDPRLNSKVIRQDEYYAEQSTMITQFIRGIGVFIAIMMAMGALFGALNTMYGAVAARVREIATLRALGFGAGPVVWSVLFESVVVALIGGTLGGLAAWMAFDGFRASTINWQTFSQVAFAFSVTPALLVRAVILATIIGVIGGLFPAIRAARLPIASALRET